MRRAPLVVSAVLLMLAMACGPKDARPSSGAGAGAAPSGSQVRITLSQEPDTLNPYYTGLRAAYTVTQTIYNGLWVVDPNGEFQPELAADVPTIRNGGVSPDGKTITVKLRPGVQWADGQPLTAADVQFTWEAVMNPANTTIGKSTYGKIRAVTVQDEHTVQLEMAEVFSDYLILFSYPQGILPRHAFGGSNDLNRAEFNRKPFGTGPYRVSEWAAASHISLEANPNYFQGRAKLDRVVFRIVPDKNTQLAQIRANETDVAVDLAESDAVEIDKLNGWSSLSVAGLSSDRLFLNLADRGAPDGSRPHPILSDKRVRQALQAAINKQQVVDGVLFGKTKVATSEYPVGMWAPNLPPSDYDPEMAKRLLDEAGWRAGAGGIREKDGRPLKLAISSTSGNRLREDVEQLIQASWKAIGVDLEIKNVAAAVLVGEWSANGMVARGDFDIAYFGFTPSIDPHSSIAVQFDTREIPRDENQGDGSNYMRYKDPQVDAWIREADATLDLATRKQLYENVMRKIAEDVPIIYLYNRANVEAVSKRVQGPHSHPFRWLTWNIHEWTLA
jgi:peptide/nickel transport system substrate-binding protein